MSDIIRILLLPFISAAQLLFEVLLAVVAYTYLNIFHVGVFGSLVVIAGDVLIFLTQHMRNFFPENMSHVYATTLGDLNPKAMLLLLVGLTVSAILRLIGWIIKTLTHNRA
ncbi:MAG: hypothetical protein AAF228_00295 [Pseudomonadota bacterium]